MTKVLARVTQETTCFFSVHGIVCLVMIRLTAALQHPIPVFLPVSRQSQFTMSKKSWQDEASSAQKPEQVRAQL